MPQVELTAGTIEYEDTGGDGPVVLLLHGLIQDASVWRDVVAELQADHRCVVPTVPFGSHRIPMRPDADLTYTGHARLLEEFVDRLDLRDVTLVQNDAGYAQAYAGRRPDRLARLVLVACEAFDNLPPGLAGKAIGLAGRLPGGVFMATQPLRLRALRRLPMTFGWMTERPIPHDLMDRWFAPLLGNRAVRRDLAKYIRGARAADQRAATESLRDFDRPALVVWARQDRFMPREHGPALAELLPHGRLAELDDCGTLVPLDQPGELARLVREFVRESVPAAA